MTLGFYMVIKVAVSILMVVVLSWVAERAGPRIAGVISGYPLGAAISLFFIGLEQGADFAARSAIFTAGGLAATLAFVAGYLLGLHRAEERGRAAALALAVLSAMATYGLTAWVLANIALGWLSAPAVALSAIVLADRAFRWVPEATIQQVAARRWVVTLCRAVFAAAVILVITAAAGIVGPRWAGLFAAFPITMLPLLVILQAAHQPSHVRTLIRNVPRGMVSLLVYTLTVAATYGRLGIVAGTLMGYLAATVYLVGLETLRKRHLRRQL
ncbi:hypothetical protein [Desulfatitalea alkaliphila]|uniref:Uncharacterized protein n=1 Tax=Desulfatitalea alkaliphila TaxID=2929485 RepID=A0AA41R417_9BACT|nr:hypothetical protein [Desulfatitalea alkaliphila]MCJ8502892.1 hypothetical protein [Desulfatitalea alkaliphila]